MSGKEPKDIIEHYRSLLAQNLILTEDFYRVLVTHGVFPEHLIKDIKNAPASERQEKLLELLSTRTTTGFWKFVDVLEVTGHHFLSDCLRENDQGSAQLVNVKDMARCLPFMQKSLSISEQSQAVEKYFDDLIHKEVVRQTWKGDIRSKEELIISRQKQIEQLWHFEEENKIRDKSLQDLQLDYLQLQDHVEGLRRECKSIHKHISDLEKKQMEEMKAQVDSNMQNDRHISKVNNVAAGADSTLESIHAELKATMAEDYSEKKAVHSYINLQNNFNLLCRKYHNTAKLVDSLRDDRQYLSNQLAGFSIKDQDDFMPHCKEGLKRNTDKISELNALVRELDKRNQMMAEKLKELNWLKDNVRDKDSHGLELSAQSALLKKDLDDKKREIMFNDDKILTLQRKVKGLNDKLMSMETSLKESRQNEQRLKEAIAAASEGVKPAREETPKSGKSEGTDHPGPPPNTQQQGKTRDKPSYNSYLLKKQASSGPVYVMDENIEERNPSVEESLPNKGLTSATSSEKSEQLTYQRRTSTNPSTAYSKRMAASKAVKDKKAVGGNFQPTQRNK